MWVHLTEGASVGERQGAAAALAGQVKANGVASLEVGTMFLRSIFGCNACFFAPWHGYFTATLWSVWEERLSTGASDSCGLKRRQQELFQSDLGH